ncbi:MAG: hypothetical protein ACFB2W_08745, partial [Leptolyngbyaceae cyanobacterium]
MAKKRNLNILLGAAIGFCLGLAMCLLLPILIFWSPTLYFRECIDFCVSAFFLWGKAFWKQNSKMREGCAPIFNGSVPFLSNIVHG